MHLEASSMANPEDNSKSKPLRLDFDRRLKPEFHGSRVTSDAGLQAYRELDDALGLTVMVGDELVDPRTGKNDQHAMKGLFRQSVFGRLGGYEDANATDRLGRDPATRWIVGRRAVAKAAASTSQMGRFETEVLATNENLTALADLLGQWIDRVHGVTRETTFSASILNRQFLRALDPITPPFPVRSKFALPSFCTS